MYASTTLVWLGAAVAIQEGGQTQNILTLPLLLLSDGIHHQLGMDAMTSTPAKLVWSVQVGHLTFPLLLLSDGISQNCRVDDCRFPAQIYLDSVIGWNFSKRMLLLSRQHLLQPSRNWWTGLGRNATGIELFCSGFGNHWHAEIRSPQMQCVQVRKYGICGKSPVFLWLSASLTCYWAVLQTGK